MYCAVIGDIIRSRNIQDRSGAQNRLKQILEHINNKFDKLIASDFMITLGDEFQGLLENPDSVIDIIECIKMKMSPVSIRFGIGIGDINTAIQRNMPFGTDGPAYHRARKMIDELKNAEKSKARSDADVKIQSEKSSVDRLVNVSLALCSFIEKKWTRKQREAISDYLSFGDSQTQTANRLGVSQSTIQRSLSSSGFYNYLYAKREIQNALKNMA